MEARSGRKKRSTAVQVVATIVFTVMRVKWPEEHIREHDVVKKHKNYGGLVMFPSSHDITKSNLPSCRTVLQNLLIAGNEVLVVSKIPI